MDSIAFVLLAIGATALGLGWYWERQRFSERERTDARIDAAVALLKADLAAQAELAATERAFGMMRNIGSTLAAGDAPLHPILERKQREAELWALAAQRKLHDDLDKGMTK